jgi:hypothetical protein
MAKLFDGIPDVTVVCERTGLAEDVVRSAVLELAFICKTTTRLGKGYVIGKHWFCRDDTGASRYLDSKPRSAEPVPITEAMQRWWSTPEDLAWTLSDRRGISFDSAETLISEIARQIDEGIGSGMKVASALLELEAVVEAQLLANPHVLAAWGWDLDRFTIKAQNRIHASSRPDIVGRLTDGRWLIIELKRGAALAPAADQIARYLELADAAFAHGDPVEGLVIADGHDREFHEAVERHGLPVTYLPTRALDLPVCRPQDHLTQPDDPNVIYDPVSFRVAADGATLVSSGPFGLEEDSSIEDRWTAGRKLLEAPHLPCELPPLGA